MKNSYKDPYSVDDLSDHDSVMSDDEYSAGDDTFVDYDEDEGLSDFELPDDDDDLEVGEDTKNSHHNND